jgi:hypothetical protein
MLRSYDAQIGRWLQNDPFDQFASGYVGMGADPANNVDPTGGFIPGGIPCPGTSGFGLFMQGVGNALSTAMPTFTTVAAVGGSGMRAATIVSGITEDGKNVLANGLHSIPQESPPFEGLNLFLQSENSENKENEEPLIEPKVWYYVLKTEGGPHSLVYDPENNMIYETNHPTVNGEAVNGRENKKAGGYKSQGYAYDMGDKDDLKDFWAFMGGRGTLLLSPVVVLKPERATAFFESNKGKEWNYNIAVNNCKHYVLQGLTAGAALIPPSEHTNPLPLSWPIPYTKFWNSTMTKPQSILKIFTK